MPWRKCSISRWESPSGLPCSFVRVMESSWSSFLTLSMPLRMGWTLREIADRSGVSSRFLSDLEAGKGNISVSRLADVARALDVPLVSLLPSEEKRQSVVALVGLRGAGKSTIGKSLAKHLGVRF